MSEKPSSLRSQAEQVYNLTDQLQVQLQVLESSRVRVDVQINPYSAAVSGGDLEAIAFIVMMQAAHSAQEDLKAIMEQAKAINASKEKLRGLFDKTQAAPPLRHGTLNFESVFQVMATLYAKQLEAETDELLGSLDSLSEMGEMESLRLQMAMDRLSKMMSTLSNLLKKASETSSQIVQNLK
jgi:hypothetical protein